MGRGTLARGRLNLSLTDGLHAAKIRTAASKSTSPRGPARGHFLVLAPLLGVEILVDMGGGPDLFGIPRAMMERERQQRRSRQRGHDMQRRDRPGIIAAAHPARRRPPARAG